jgi:hypothetical protein
MLLLGVVSAQMEADWNFFYFLSSALAILMEEGNGVNGKAQENCRSSSKNSVCIKIPRQAS